MNVPERQPWLAEFRCGLAAPWDGFCYLRRHPRLWRFAFVAVLLNLLITSLVVVFLLAAVGATITYVHPLFPTDWHWVAIEVLCALGLVLLALGLAFTLWIVLQGVLCGHYYAKLAREVELQLGMSADEMQDIPWGYQIADACRDAVAFVAINGGFLLLHIVPVIGSVVGLVGSLYFDWLLFGREYLDYPLALRGKRRAEKKEFTRRHRYQTLGLGAVVFAVTFVPVIGAIALTTAVVGAVLLHRRLESLAYAMTP